MDTKTSIYEHAVETNTFDHTFNVSESEYEQLIDNDYTLVVMVDNKPYEIKARNANFNIVEESSVVNPLYETTTSLPKWDGENND